MSRRQRSPGIPRSRQRDFRELDSAHTEPTEELSNAMQGPGPKLDREEDVGPARAGRTESSAITFADLKTLGKVVGAVLTILITLGPIIWWAATIQWDVNNLSSDIGQVQKTTRSLEKEFVRHDEKLQRIESEVSSLRKRTERDRAGLNGETSDAEREGE